MPVPTKRWYVPPPPPPEVEETLAGYPPLLRRIIYNRGYAKLEEAQRYLEARPPEGCDPFNLLDMPKAVQRLEQAIHNGELIAIYGDYDVDGVSATALLSMVLARLGAKVQGYIPNRFEEGYGLNKDALESLRNQDVQVVVTVDCGIRSPAETSHAANLGLDLIITDHHSPSGELPRALAIVNPKQEGDVYPDKNLAGVGLAYKLASALVAHLQQNGAPVPEDLRLDDYLDLVALGTVADLAPLKGENRALVRAGLLRIRKQPRVGVHALARVAEVDPRKVGAWEIGFNLGPRLNAAGRLDSALASLRLLTTQDVAEAGLIAQQLDSQNRERQRLTREIQAEAEQIALAEEAHPLLLFAASPTFNSGVVGLTASRLMEQYYRPAIVGFRGEEFTRASCRSIPEFHITEALDRCAHLLEHHGGHAAAAGFTVRNDHLPELLDNLRGLAAEQLAHLDLRPELTAEAEVSLDDLQKDLLEYLDWLQPIGYGNGQAIFLTRDLHVSRYRAVGREKDHLKLTVTNGWTTMDAIAFRMGDWAEHMPPKVDLMYTFELNVYNGVEALQINVRDMKPSGVA